jgi:hypothetical protein
MSKTIKSTNKIFRTLVLLILAASLLAVIVPSASAQEEFLPPNHGFSVNYYDSYGEPEICASVAGDREFEKGETGEIRINLANNGVFYGCKSVKTVGDSKYKLLSSQKEMEYEASRTTALGIKVNLVSPSEFIEIDPENNCQTLDKLVSGEVTGNPLVFTISVSNNAPAGDYFLELPITYEYQSSVEMTNGDLIRLGISDMDHVTFYKTVNENLTIPVHVKEVAMFEVIETSADIVSGKSGTVNVTYLNIGEVAAEDSVVRIITMSPLSTEKSVVPIGTIDSGESKTVSFEISAESGAIKKNYGIDSEIKYVDEDGEIKFSKILKIDIPPETKEQKSQMNKLPFIGIAVTGLYLIVRIVRRKGKF